MPYKIVKMGNRVCVVREKMGGRPQKTMHCYPASQRSAAEAYMRALYANEAATNTTPPDQQGRRDD